MRRVGAELSTTGLRAESRRRPEAHDQRSRTFQKIAARTVHARLASAYLLMARSILTCAKQRHSTPPNALRMSWSVAVGFASNTALAVRITPLRQNPHCAAPSAMNAC